MIRPWNTTPDRYGTGPRLLHWLIALLVITALVFIETRGWAPRGSAQRRNLREWHQQAALMAFVLVWLRIVFRLRNRPPRIEPAPPAWQERLAHALHLVFYVLLVTLPLLGMATVQAQGRPVSLFGATLPVVIASNKALGGTLANVHGLLGDVIIGAIVLHIVATLWHQFVLRDNTLRRMV